MKTFLKLVGMLLASLILVLLAPKHPIYAQYHYTSSAARMIWTNGQGGVNLTTSATTALNPGNWTPSLPIVITQIDTGLSSALGGCTTAPIFGVYDTTKATWVATITHVNGNQYDSATMSGPVSAGDFLTFGLKQDAVGCSTGVNVYWTVEYTMQ